VIKRILALLKKDILLELRQQHTFYGIILYIASTIFVIFLSTENKLESGAWNSMFWVIQLFVCINAVAKSFLQEGSGRMLYFHTITSPVEFIISKIIYNILLIVIMSSISLVLFFTFITSPVSNLLQFTGIALLGGISISLVFTLMSAIAAKAQQNAALMAIMGFPVILPQLLLLMKLSKSAFAEVFKAGALWQLAAQVAAIDVLAVAMALVLFPYLWKD
jgi:heme exporter protein B